MAPPSSEPDGPGQGALERALARPASLRARRRRERWRLIGELAVAAALAGYGSLWALRALQAADEMRDEVVERRQLEQEQAILSRTHEELGGEGMRGAISVAGRGDQDARRGGLTSADHKGAVTPVDE